MKKLVSEVVAEFKKVTWPSKKEVINSTGLVVGLSLGMGIYLGAFDFGFTKLIEILVKFLEKVFA